MLGLILFSVIFVCVLTYTIIVAIDSAKKLAMLQRFYEERSARTAPPVVALSAETRDYYAGLKPRPSQAPDTHCNTAHR